MRLISPKEFINLPPEIQSYIFYKTGCSLNFHNGTGMYFTRVPQANAVYASWGSQKDVRVIKMHTVLRLSGLFLIREVDWYNIKYDQLRRKLKTLKLKIPSYNLEHILCPY